MTHVLMCEVTSLCHQDHQLHRACPYFMPATPNLRPINAAPCTVFLSILFPTPGSSKQHSLSFFPSSSLHQDHQSNNAFPYSMPATTIHAKSCALLCLPVVLVVPEEVDKAYTCCCCCCCCSEDVKAGGEGRIVEVLASVAGSACMSCCCCMPRCSSGLLSRESSLGSVYLHAQECQLWAISWTSRRSF